MTRGQEIRSFEYFGVMYYVGTSPYGRDFTAPKECFEEVCEMFDKMEAAGWNQW